MCFCQEMQNFKSGQFELVRVDSNSVKWVWLSRNWKSAWEQPEKPGLWDEMFTLNRTSLFWKWRCFREVLFTAFKGLFLALLQVFSPTPYLQRDLYSSCQLRIFSLGVFQKTMPTVVRGLGITVCISFSAPGLPFSWVQIRSNEPADEVGHIWATESMLPKQIRFLFLKITPTKAKHITGYVPVNISFIFSHLILQKDLKWWWLFHMHH